MSRNVMETENKTEVTEIVLLGLSQTHEVQLFLFFLFLLFYVIVLPVNILIILIVRGDPQLDSQMYFFLAILAFLDICYVLTPPKMLADFFQQKTISTRSCIAQLFFLHFLGGAEIFLLIAMAFDLHYATLMRKMLYWVLVGTAWAGGFTHSIIQVALVVHLPFCGPNELDSFFCDVTQVINLACTNTYILEFTMFVNSGLVIFICFILLLISYGVLLIHLKTGISRGKSKAVSTCTTHIIIAFVMFGPAIYIYCWPFCSLPLDKMVAVFHTMVFPLKNPMIYTLRNREILSAMKRLLVQYFLRRGK
ncbi:LOW QUALITY PROTEIN: olfactory receptor 4N5-like [Ciconia maguari]